MAVIECFSREDKTSLGFIKIINNKTHCGYIYDECTHMSLDDAIELVYKLNAKYLYTIYREETDRKIN